MTAKLDTTDAEKLALRSFGVAGSATELGGERTQNFRISVPGGPGFTLKVSDPEEDAGLIELENEVLLHLEQHAPLIEAPRIVPSLEGAYNVSLGRADGRTLRLLSYIPGVPLVGAKEPSSSLWHSLGKSVAALDVALTAFDHPLTRHRDLIWGIRNIARVRDFLPLLDAGKRSFAEAMLDRFQAIPQPTMASLPAQAIHSDMNGQNILVRLDDPQRLAGFLDFGDIHQGPRIVDLAGAALLGVDIAGNNLQAITDVVNAYRHVSPLQDSEVDLFPEFMIARCVINVTVTEWLAELDPANRAYIMKNNPASWERLRRLSSLPDGCLRNILHAQDKGSMT